MKIDYIVSNNGNGNYKTITEALANAKEGQTIYVKSGIYKEHFVIDKKIKLIGDIENRPEVTNVSDNVCVVKANAVIKNIIFSNIADNFVDEDEVEQYSILRVLASPLIDNCEIVGSSRIGLEISHQSNATIVNTKISRNSSYNVYIDFDSNPTFNYCDIHTGESNGLFVCDDACCSFINCSIHDNFGSNIEVEEIGSIFMEECTITDSECYGLEIDSSANGTIKNCYFAYNQDSNISIEDCSSLDVLNCEITDGERFGIEISTEGKATIKNCKVVDNEEGDITISDNTKVDIIDCKYKK